MPTTTAAAKIPTPPRRTTTLEDTKQRSSNRPVSAAKKKQPAKKYPATRNGAVTYGTKHARISSSNSRSRCSLPSVNPPRIAAAIFDGDRKNGQAATPTATIAMTQNIKHEPGFSG